MRGGVREECVAHSFLPTVVETRRTRVRFATGCMSTPRSPPQPGRARRLSCLAFGLRAAVNGHLSWTGEVRTDAHGGISHLS